MKKVKLILLVFKIIIAIPSLASNNLYLAFPFSDHGVLQQEKPIPIWGKALPNATVVAEIGDNRGYGRADSSGKWLLYLPACSAGGPYELIVKSNNEQIKRKDIYIGEVWLASGQSNMAWKMQNGVGPNTDQDISDANYPQIRFLNVPNETHSIPIEKLAPVDWEVCTPEHVKSFSAIAYYFARELYQHHNVPIGIISASWGATDIEAWMSADVLRTHNAYTKWVEGFDTDSLKWQNYVCQSQKNDRIRDSIATHANRGIRKKVFSPNYKDDDWLTVDTPVNTNKMKLNNYWGVTWLRTDFEVPANLSKQSLLLDGSINVQNIELWLNGTKLTPLPSKKFEFPARLLKRKNQLTARVVIHWGSAWLGTDEQPLILTTQNGMQSFRLDNPWKFNATLEPELPGWQNYYNTHTVIYNAMIHPLMPYSMRGIFWYQGENNVGKAKQYQSLLPKLIESWRIGFKQGNLPFITIQLANYMKRASEPLESKWAELREAQAMSLRYPNTGLVTTIDIGETNDIHPRNKLDVGRRLYQQAQSLVYDASIIGRGPTFRKMEIEGDKIRIYFDNVSGGLKTKDGDQPKSFAIAGSDQQFYWTDTAYIEGETIVVYSDKVPNPVSLRYGWADNPEVNLYNSDDLPAVPFRTDNWN